MIEIAITRSFLQASKQMMNRSLSHARLVARFFRAINLPEAFGGQCLETSSNLRYQAWQQPNQGRSFRFYAFQNRAKATVPDYHEDSGASHSAGGNESSNIGGLKPVSAEVGNNNDGPKISKRHNMMMLYTCKVCETRSMKSMSRESYERGIVIVRCSGCQNLHLIADRFGWFGEAGSVEDFLREQGVDQIRKGCEESYQFTVEDLAGWSPKGDKDVKD